MAYIDQWNKLKDDFKAENDDLKEKIKTAKAKLKKLQKTKPEKKDKIEDLEYVIENTITLSKKPTGYSKVLPIYDKLLAKMEQMIDDGVPASDKKSWSPYVKALGQARKDLDKATASARTQFGKIEEMTTRGYAAYRKEDAKPEEKEVHKHVTGKTLPASHLLRGLTSMQRDMQTRLTKILTYLNKEMSKWD